MPTTERRFETLMERRPYYLPHAEHMSNRWQNQRRVAERCQRDEADAVREVG